MKTAQTPCAFSIAEAVLSVVLVAVLLIAALRTAGASAVSQNKSADRARAILLAQGLVDEILARSYKDPGASPVFGLEAGETLGVRSTYNDVDDYSGLNETTIKQGDGTVINVRSGWTRTTRVEWVASTTLTQTTASSSETGVKRITVSVYRQNALLAKLIAFKANAP